MSIGKIATAAAIAVMLTAGSSSTAQNQQSGQHGELLKRALADSAKGNCSATLMSPMLRGTCQQQMPGLGNMLAQRGPISSVEFFGIQNTGMGPAEVYKVNFSAGSMMWMISTGPDGKIVVLWSAG